VRMDFDDIGLSPNRPKSHSSKAKTRGHSHMGSKGI